MLKNYYTLTKPGIIYGNLLTSAAGFFLASRGQINFWLLFETLAGVALVIASACVFNNYIDRNIDSKMSRTKVRALVTGSIAVKNAVILASILGVAGFLVLAFYTNITTFSLGVIAFFVYVVLYGFSKRYSIHGTLVGSIAGALPPAAGYTAVTNKFDVGALLLFLILVFWQMPHFYAIAIYRFNDYKAAGIPSLPLKKGVQITKINMLIFVIAFIIAGLMLTVFGYTGYSFAIVTALLGFTWLWLCIKGFWVSNNSHWARKMFSLSLVVLMSLCIMILVDMVIRQKMGYTF